MIKNGKEPQLLEQLSEALERVQVEQLSEALERMQEMPAQDLKLMLVERLQTAIRQFQRGENLAAEAELRDPEPQENGNDIRAEAELRVAEPEPEEVEALLNIVPSHAVLLDPDFDPQDRPDPRPNDTAAFRRAVNEQRDGAAPGLTDGDEHEPEAPRNSKI